MKIVCVVVVAVFAAGCTERSPDPSDIGPTPEPRVQQATRAQTSTNQDKPGYLGVLVPRGLAEVTAPFTSSLVRLEAKLGDHVVHGQHLALLDDRPLQEELKIANAVLKASIAAARQADVERRAAATTFVREQRAFEAGISSHALLTTAEFELRKAETNVGRAAANVEEQRARVAQLTARVGDTVLKAPIDGRVALLYARPGDRVEEGHGVIRVISSDELFVKFAIPADSVGTLSPGDEVDIVIDQQRLTTPGIVRHVAPEIDPIAKMILADAEMTNPPPTLQSGIDCRIVPSVKP